ncbi:MAG: hypothetical protein ACLU72_16070, partial [Blautia wexlerae]
NSDNFTIAYRNHRSNIVYEDSVKDGVENVIVHTPLSREVFWHEYAKIPRHTSQNSIAVGNLE